MAIGYGVPVPKPEPRKRTKARRERHQAAADRLVRMEVFDREQAICRCCRRRLAESRHEIVPRSLGGKVTTANCIAVCGSGTTGCHGFLQSYRIWVNQVGQDGKRRPGMAVDANQPLVFTPATEHARAWMAGR